MHDGSIRTLGKALNLCSKGGLPNPDLDMAPLQLALIVSTKGTASQAHSRRGCRPVPEILAQILLPRYSKFNHHTWLDMSINHRFADTKALRPK